MKEIPFNLYIGAEVETSNGIQALAGVKILDGIDEDDIVRVAVYYPTFENHTHKEVYRCPKACCKLILRSLDEDITEEEEIAIQKMGFSISCARNYILDEIGSDKRIRVHAAAELIIYLIKQKFSLGLFSKNDYIVKPRKTKS